MEIKLFVLFIMVLAHIIADFNIQNDVIAKFKCKDFWKNNYPDKLYRYDYIIVLFIHGFTWSIIVSLPLIVYGFIYFGNGANYNILLQILFHTAFHAWIDNAKANLKEINLIQDQILHLLQVVLIWSIYILGWR